MSIKLNVPLDGSTGLGSVLEEKVQVGTRGRGLGGLLGGETSNVMPFPGTSVMPTGTFEGNSPNTANNWTASVGTGNRNGIISYDTTIKRIFMISTGGGTVDDRFSIPLDSTITEDTDFKCQVKFSYGTPGARIYFGLMNSVDSSTKNALVYFNNGGPWFANGRDSGSGQTISSAGTTLTHNVDYWLEVINDSATTTFTVNIHSTSPGAIGGDWSAATPLTTRSIDYGTKSFSLDIFTWASVTVGFGGTQLVIEEMFCDQVDFQGYSTTQTEIVVPQIFLDGALDPSTADAIILKDKSDTPEALTTSLIKIAYSVDGGSFSSFLTFNNFRLEDIINPDTSLDFKLQFNNADIADLIEIFDFSAGDFTGTTTSGFGGGGVVTRFSPSQLNAELIQSVMRDLELKRASVSTVDILDGTIGDDTGDIIIDIGSTITVDITASDANGLDTGSETSSTWYYIYVIFNPTTEVLSGLLSISPTSPTLPSGYTLKKLVGAVFNDSGSDFLDFQQLDGEITYISAGSVLSSGTATTFTSVSLSDFVPPEAKKVRAEGRAEASGADATTRTMEISQDGTNTHTTLFFNSDSNTVNVNVDDYTLVTAQTLYYKVSDATAADANMAVLGFTMKI